MNKSNRSTNPKVRDGRPRMLYLALLCRSTGYEDRPDCCHLNLPVRYAWQEDANDLHIQLNTPFGRDRGNICPEVDADSGDYLIPSSPWLLRHLGRDYEPDILPAYKWNAGCGDKPVCDAVRVYSFEWSPVPIVDSGGVVAPRSYITHLEDHWNSPNR